MRTRSLGVMVLGAILLAGCGQGEVVKVGEPDADPGVLKRDIDLAKDTAAKANARSQDE